MKKPALLRALALAVLSLTALFSPAAWAAYSCSLTTQSVGVLYVFNFSNFDANGTVILTCTRNVVADANTLTYRIKADNGLNWSGTNRRARLGATGNRLTYYLRRGTTAGGGATCGNSSTWFAPATGTTNVITGTLSFGAAATASVTWGFCARVRGNQGAVAAGLYTDMVGIVAQYPNNNAGALTVAEPMYYQIGVTSQCVFNLQPHPIVFNYTSFSPTPQVASRNFEVRCSNTLPWSVSIPSPSGTLLGLSYSLAASPASGTGTGADQIVTVTGTIPAGQAGTCSTAICTGANVHTILITY
ncbi:spore coat protein U domain-containing protein [Polaromonas sp.]|uniref:spore coat protein U domain-containing protein n=1 Tax=Polaromonas sp. TaxID=1869339 RepID=UPI002FCAFAF4